MSRAGFITRLRAALSGLPQSEIDEIVADYEAHFAEAAAAGRSEADVAAALGEPPRLAKELKAEAGLKRLEAKPTPGNLAVAVSAFLGLLTLNFIFVLPILSVIFAIMLGWAVGAPAIFIAGVALLFHGLLEESGREALAQALGGIGLAGLGVGGCALWVLTLRWLITIFVSYARLHYRVLKPALQD